MLPPAFTLRLLLSLSFLLLAAGMPETIRATETLPLGQLPPAPPKNVPIPSDLPGFMPLAVPHHFLFGNKQFPLPAKLTVQQQRVVFDVITEAEPRLIALHAQLRQTLEGLHNLSFCSDTPPDALSALGRELIRLRGELLIELRALSTRLEKQAGFNPGWGSRRVGIIHQSTACPLCEEEKERAAKLLRMK